MKIILPVENYDGPRYSVVQNLFNAEYACIYNTEDKTYEWITMRSISKKDGNLSIELKRRGVNTVICSSIPLLALELFAVSGFNLYKATAKNVLENIQLFENNSLHHLTERNAAEESCSASACSSCSSSCS